MTEEQREEKLSPEDARKWIDDLLLEQQKEAETSLGEE
jgi:hypothetical protein